MLIEKLHSPDLPSGAVHLKPSPGSTRKLCEGKTQNWVIMKKSPICGDFREETPMMPSRRVKIEVSIEKELGDADLNGFIKQKHQVRFGSSLLVSQPCHGEIDVLEYMAAHMKGNTHIPHSLSYVRPFKVEEFLPEVEIFFHLLVGDEIDFLIKINKIIMLSKWKPLARSLLLLLSPG